MVKRNHIRITGELFNTFEKFFSSKNKTVDSTFIK